MSPSTWRIFSTLRDSTLARTEPSISEKKLRSGSGLFVFLHSDVATRLECPFLAIFGVDLLAGDGDALSPRSRSHELPQVFTLFDGDHRVALLQVNRAVRQVRAWLLLGVEGIINVGIDAVDRRLATGQQEGLGVVAELGIAEPFDGRFLDPVADLIHRHHGEQTFGCEVWPATHEAELNEECVRLLSTHPHGWHHRQQSTQKVDVAERVGAIRAGSFALTHIRSQFHFGGITRLDQTLPVDVGARLAVSRGDELDDAVTGRHEAGQRTVLEDFLDRLLAKGRLQLLVSRLDFGWFPGQKGTADLTVLAPFWRRASSDNVAPFDPLPFVGSGNKLAQRVLVDAIADVELLFHGPLDILCRQRLVPAKVEEIEESSGPTLLDGNQYAAITAAEADSDFFGICLDIREGLI